MSAVLIFVNEWTCWCECSWPYG